ncbi:hypothetical protein [Tsukamurella sp. 1534]|uniref:phthiocerol/phthiodiolone dimycocerosyl transferase family protein n=1 Tax=Tsukamurella sp. 1534 TaxID=1151061 RepID=UPI00031E7072|nr:hypothetical protein [Tsukamurella sp. 1534]
MTRTLRRLAPSERGFVGAAPTTVAFEFTARGDLDLAALSDAFAAVRAGHPALDATVVADGDGFAFAAPAAGAGAALTVDRVGVLPASFAPPLVDPAAALGRLHVVTDGARHRVTFGANHALADGTHLFALVAGLWSQYTALVRTGSALPVEPSPFPAPAQDVLAGVATGTDTGRDRLGGIRWYGAAPAGPAPGAGAPPEVASLQFCEEVTTGFAAVAAGVGLNALLSGVLLCAERAGFIGEPADAPVRLGSMTLVDLRRRIAPTLGATDVTNFVGASFAAADLTAASDPIAVGSAVAAAVREDVAAGRCLNVLAAPADPGPAQPPVVLSNLGPLALELPGALEGEALRPIVSMDAAALYGRAGRRAPSPSATICQASTFAGRLGIELITLGGTASPASRAAVADRVTALVHAAARLAPAA